MKKKTTVSCASCHLDKSERVCVNPEGKASRACPTVSQPELLERANREIEKPEIAEFARQASIQEAACYANREQKPYIMQPTKTRIQEICEFSRRMGYRRLGVAFCLGLADEANAVAEVFGEQGFEVISAVCKAGRTPKADLGLEAEDTIALDDSEAMCNPIYQALLLNDGGAQMNVLLGLCVGHDSLFFKYAEAPTTVLAVKDRVTGHNPLAPIYLRGSYYRKITKPDL
jgi:uncharacterized metal-binding protein